MLGSIIFLLIGWITSLSLDKLLQCRNNWHYCIILVEFSCLCWIIHMYASCDLEYSDPSSNVF